MSTERPLLGDDVPEAPAAHTSDLHEYDGIQEYDNPMPRWWVLSFWATFYFAVCYAMWFHVYHRGISVEEEYGADMGIAREEAARRELGANVTEEALQKLMANAAVMSDTRATFGKRCVQCHGADGQGVIGPNLTDDYWLHGQASLMDIYGVVKAGVPAKGMPEWGKQLSSIEVAKLAAYVGSIRGKHLPGRAPEGTLLASVAPAGK
jgi:cytochrome c oxidase cbb3-type subunit 3